MWLYHTFIFLFLSHFLSCNALRCTTSCSFTYNLTTPFNIPDQCNHLVSAEKCHAEVVFWYDRGEYDVSLRADSSGSLTYNYRSALLQFSSHQLTFFAYTIDQDCTNKDDCARDLIKNVANDILQRQLNYSAIMNEVRGLVTYRPSLTPDDSNLNCYDSDQNVAQCGTSTEPGSCIISEEILHRKISVDCDTKLAVGNAYISIHQSDVNYASFDVHCNRSLCNTQSTLQAAKEVMFKYKVTVTPDGRLNGSRLIISTSLMILMIFILFSNRF